MENKLRTLKDIKFTTFNNWTEEDQIINRNIHHELRNEAIRWYKSLEKNLSTVKDEEIRLGNMATQEFIKIFFNIKEEEVTQLQGSDKQ